MASQAILCKESAFSQRGFCVDQKAQAVGLTQWKCSQPEFSLELRLE